jgi:hypothetical protein
MAGRMPGAAILRCLLGETPVSQGFFGVARTGGAIIIGFEEKG